MKLEKVLILCLNRAIALTGAINQPKTDVKVSKEEISNLIDFDSYVKMHYETPINDEQLGHLLEKGREYITESVFIKNNIIEDKKIENEIRGLLLEGLEEADKKYTGEKEKRRTCGWAEKVMCQPMKLVALPCIIACGPDYACLKIYFMVSSFILCNFSQFSLLVT